jgi:hypothetical protein
MLMLGLGPGGVNPPFFLAVVVGDPWQLPRFQVIFRVGKFLFRLKLCKQIHDQRRFFPDSVRAMLSLGSMGRWGTAHQYRQDMLTARRDGATLMGR